jgi:hypothetical protein
VKKASYTLLLACMLISCGNKHKGEKSTSLLSNLLSITDNEDKGVKEVLDFYGGYCEYSIGASISTDKGKQKYFELKVSKSEVLDKYADMPDVLASNIAYLFYKNLKSENKNYSEIHSVLLFSKVDKYEHSYTLDQLELMSAKMIVVNKVIDLIKAKNFAGLKPFLSNDSYTDKAKDTLTSNLQKVDPEFGNVKEFRTFGFRFETLNGFNVLNVLGAIMRDKQNNQISLKIDLKPGEDKIHYLDYKF